MPKNTNTNTHPPCKNNSIIIIIPVTTFSQGTKQKRKQALASQGECTDRENKEGEIQVWGASKQEECLVRTWIIPLLLCFQYLQKHVESSSQIVCTRTRGERERENTKARKTLNPELRVSRVLLPIDLQTTLK
jgi:hypothetical protein